MENLTHVKNDSKNDVQGGASCNASMSTPFFIFIGLAAVVGVILYVVFK
jgi:hypothetical protein